MICRTTEIAVNPTPKEIAEEIYHDMNSLERVSLMLHLSRRFDFKNKDLSAQLNSLAEDFNDVLIDEERNNIIAFFENLTETLKEADKQKRKEDYLK